jgi:hypothetical protein
VRKHHTSRSSRPPGAEREKRRQYLGAAALDVKDVDQNFDIPEDVIPLIGEVVLHEGLLTTAIPEIERQIAEKSDVRMLDIDCGSQNTTSEHSKRW